MNVLEKISIGAIGAAGFVKLVKEPRLDDARLRKRGPRIQKLIQKSEMRSALMRAFVEDPAHRELFARRPRRGRVDIDELERLPVGSLGRAFAENVRTRGFDPNLGADEADDGTEISYLMANMKETHDLWHLVTGFDTDVAGEMGLSAFGFAQVYVTPAPLILSAFILNTFLYRMDERYRRMDALTRGWQLGRTAKPLLGFDWKSHFSTPLAEVREKLGLPADPGSAIGTSIRANQTMTA